MDENIVSRFDLKYLRNRVGLTQEEMAKLLNERFQRIGSLRGRLHRNSIVSWENGRHFPRLTPPETLELCDLLGCTLLELTRALENSRV